jgi:Transglycosylase SLT domain/Peptidase family M23
LVEPVVGGRSGMRNKLALTIALASFALATALGVGLAGAEPAATESAQPLTTAPALPATPTAQLPVCSNGLDDDGDGLVDLSDPDCLNDPAGISEAPAPTAPPAEAEAPAVEAPAGGGLEVGSSLDAGKAANAGRKVVHNQSLGVSPGGGVSTESGGVSAPSATAGVQPPAEGVSGGSAFLDGGSPTSENPSVTIAPFGPAPIGVPNFIIDSFEIPPFLLPIYQACGTEYGIPWEVLASINKIETAFGTNLNVSTAGAMGWMQFIPSSWAMYGVDANGDGRKDPYNPVDAICAAAKYLNAAGGTKDLYGAIFSYNHADWYVQEVLLYAKGYGKIPTDLVGSLTGLTEGAHFPVAADARYADDISARAALKRATPGERKSYGNAADVITSSPTRRGINIFAAEGAPVVAVNDGVIQKSGNSKKLGKYVVLEDAYGNRFTYAELGQVVREHRKVVMPTGKEKRVPVDSENIRPRLFALPGRDGSKAQAAARERVDPATATGADGTLKVGSKVIAGTVLGRIGASAGGVDPHINFSIRPAGRGAPRIDPKPILDGWKLLEATAIYRAHGKSALTANLGGAGVLLLPKEELQQRVLADKHLEIYECGRTDIASGQIDRRILAMLEYLVSKGFKLSITSLKCGHSYMTSSGYVSEHSTGDAVDIAVIDGVPVTGNQGPGTLTDELIRTVLQLQGTMHPHQVISLEDLPGETSFALPDHYDHVHVGYHPLSGPFDQQFNSLLKPGQWARLTHQLGEIENPEVATEPSDAALPDKKVGDAKAAKSGGTESGD